MDLAIKNFGREPVGALNTHPSLGITATLGKSLKGKTIVLAVTGSVACVKSFELCRELMRRGTSVRVVMSKAALGLISEDMMEYSSGNKVITEITGKVEHVELFGENGSADLLLIAPATANTISKIAMGIDDTPVTTIATTAIGSKFPVIIAPAMHYSMYEHPIVKENLERLSAKGFIRIVQPMISEDKAKFAGIEHIVLDCERSLSRHALEGKRVIVVSGRSSVEIDAVRVITNKSSGKMGIEIAKEFYRQGADVCIIHNKSAGLHPSLPFREIEADSYDDFFEKTLTELGGSHAAGKDYDALVCPAALSDFRPERITEKIDSKKKFSVRLHPNKKLLSAAREKFPKLFIVGFKAETFSGEKLLNSAKSLMKENNLQMVVANNVKKNPFGADSSEVLILARKKKMRVFGAKEVVAEKIVKEIAKIMK